MRTYRDAKLMAKALREALAPQAELSHAQTLEIVARQFGFDDWNILAAKIGRAEKDNNEAELPTSPPDGINLGMGIPVLRIFDVDKTKEFYLGFTMDWDHRFAPNLPLYMQVSRSGLKLHLSEHHGDASPGSTVFVWMQGVDAYRAELIRKSYPYSKPGIQEEGPGGRTLEVPDPFGNRIRFCEKRG